MAASIHASEGRVNLARHSVRHTHPVSELVLDSTFANCRIAGCGRPRRHGRGLPRDPAAAGAHGRAQGRGARARRRPDLPCSLRARDPPGGGDRPPERDPGLRGRRARRAALPRDALGRGRRPPAADRRVRAPRPRAGGADRGAGRVRARGGARRRAGPPRREAGERPAGGGEGAGARLPDRLRADARRRLGHPAHPDRRPAGHRGVHGSRAARGASGERAHRRLRARLRAARGPHRPAPSRAAPTPPRCWPT